jgi:hypothetical protein
VCAGSGRVGRADLWRAVVECRPPGHGRGVPDDGGGVAGLALQEDGARAAADEVTSCFSSLICACKWPLTVICRRWMLEKAVRACGVRLETTPEQTPTSVSRSSSSGSTSSVVTLTGDALPGIRALAGSSSQRPNSSPTSRYDVRSELPHLQSYEDHLLQRNRRDAAVHLHQGRYGERMIGLGTIGTVARRLEELRVSESVPAGQRYTTLTVAAGLDVTGAPLEPNTGPELPLALAEVSAGVGGRRGLR